MRTCFFLLALAMSAHLYSQSVNFSTSIGYATVKKNDYRGMAVANNNGLTVDFRINNYWMIETGVAANNLRFHSIGNKLLVHEQLLQLPLSLKHEVPLGKHTALSIQAGGYIYWLVQEKAFNNELGQSVKGRSNLGNTAGGYFGLGFQTKVVRNWNFIAAIVNQLDLIANYKKQEDQLTANSTLLQIGFQYRVFR